MTPNGLWWLALVGPAVAAGGIVVTIVLFKLGPGDGRRARRDAICSDLLGALQETRWAVEEAAAGKVPRTVDRERAARLAADLPQLRSRKVETAVTAFNDAAGDLFDAWQRSAEVNELDRLRGKADANYDLAVAAVHRLQGLPVATGTTP